MTTFRMYLHLSPSLLPSHQLMVSHAHKLAHTPHTTDRDFSTRAARCVLWSVQCASVSTYKQPFPCLKALSATGLPQDVCQTPLNHKHTLMLLHSQWKILVIVLFFHPLNHLSNRQLFLHFNLHHFLSAHFLRGLVQPDISVFIVILMSTLFHLPLAICIPSLNSFSSLSKAKMSKTVPLLHSFLQVFSVNGVWLLLLSLLHGAMQTTNNWKSGPFFWLGTG